MTKKRLPAKALFITKPKYAINTTDDFIFSDDVFTPLQPNSQQFGESKASKNKKRGKQVYYSLIDVINLYLKKLKECRNFAGT